MCNACVGYLYARSMCVCVCVSLCVRMQVRVWDYIFPLLHGADDALSSAV